MLLPRMLAAQRSSDSTLKALVLNNGSADVAIDPSFDPAVTAYTAEVESGVRVVTVTATPTDDQATVASEPEDVDADASPTAATSAVAVNGPIPGMASSRRQAGCAADRRDLRIERLYAPVQTAQFLAQIPQQRPALDRQLILRVFQNLRQTPTQCPDPLPGLDAVFQQETVQRVRVRRAVFDSQLPRPAQLLEMPLAD